ncbi:MAG: SLC13 family permease [Eubacterium sp.]|nr:SLC13 family permease [Eubacterium sp.]
MRNCPELILTLGGVGVNGFIDFCKREFSVVISFLAALISCLLVPVTNYVDYIDTDTIGLLFCLMIAVAGFRDCGLLTFLSGKLLGGDEPKSRRTGTVLVFISFFTFTNDVALIAFVPLTAALFEGLPGTMIYVITLQTAAANLGSMLTPFGNPQNLYLYDRYGMSAGEFFSLTLPVTAAGAALILLLCVPIKNEPLKTHSRRGAAIRNKRYLALYAALFLLCLLTVFGKISVIVTFASVCIVAAIIDMRIFAAVDYGLLATFAFFFIFVGNIRNIGAVGGFITRLTDGREMLAAAAVSQVVSNVPAAVMLSGFTENARALVLGTNIGGLGTIVASLASLISFRVYLETDEARPARYLGVFTIVNVLMLAAMLAFAYFCVL